MTAPRMADTRQCPYCKAWIAMPARFAHKAFEAHKAKCSAACLQSRMPKPAVTIEAVVLRVQMPACPECSGVQRHKLAPRCSRIGQGNAIVPLPRDFPGIYNRDTDTYDMPSAATVTQGALL